MKVAISCDDIISRDHLTEVVEIVLEVFETAEVYTLIHKQGGILGPIELRRINSTFLSNKFKTREELASNSYLVPGAAKNLFIPCSVDLIVNISNGLSHGIRKCETIPQITYLYNDYYSDRENKGFFEKLFSKFVKSWSMKSLKNSTQLWVSNSSLKDKVSPYFNGEIKVVNPPFNISDYPIIPSPIFKYDHYCVSAEGLSVSFAKEISDYFESNGIKFKFFGIDGHLNSMKTSEEDSRFFGNRCSGELAPLLAGCRAVITFSKRPFPLDALKSLSTGRPVICLDSERNRSFLQSEGVLFSKENFQDLKENIAKMDSIYNTFEGTKLRNLPTNFHNLKFKAFLAREVDKLNLSKTKETQKDSTCC